MTPIASAPSSSAFKKCSGCKRPAQGTTICRIGSGQAKSGKLGRRRSPDDGGAPGRPQFSQMNATTTPSPPAARHGLLVFGAVATPLLIIGNVPFDTTPVD
jgi:hypothetical protein